MIKKALPFLVVGAALMAPALMTQPAEAAMHVKVACSTNDCKSGNPPPLKPDEAYEQKIACERL